MPPRPPPQFVLFGGSFNPVHMGHMEIIRRLAGTEGIAQVLVMPAAQSPFKAGVPVLPAELRHHMLRAATAGMERVAVLDWELVRKAPSYTIATVAQARAAFPSARLWLAMGMDVYAHFAAWHRASELLALAGLAVFPRAGAENAPPAPERLPEPWLRQARRGPEGHLECADGRRLVWWLPLELPPLAASDILRTRRLESVPAAARPMLEDHWRRGETAVRP